MRAGLTCWSAWLYLSYLCVSCCLAGGRLDGGGGAGIGGRAAMLGLDAAGVHHQHVVPPADTTHNKLVLRTIRYNTIQNNINISLTIQYLGNISNNIQRSKLKNTPLVN